MSGPDLSSTLRSTDHDFIAGLRFLDEYAKHVSSRTAGYRSENLGHGFVPRFDLEEQEQAYELFGELPGFDKDHMTVEANDDRNIQISGWIPRRQRDTAAVSAETSSGADVSDPFVTVQHHDVPKAERRTSLERFGEALNPRRELPSDDPVVSESYTAPHAPAPTHVTPHENRPETARFGDGLNSHASFVHRPKDGEVTKPKVRYLIAERQFGQFHRAFHFPSPIKKDEVTARMDNGVLHITAPRAAVPPPTKVEIKKAPQS